VSGEEPRIFTLVSGAVLGELGDETRVTTFPDCDVCGLRPPPQVTFLEYRFDYWDGEDLVDAVTDHAVSDRLRAALEEAHITGVAFEDMKSTTSDYFELGPNAYATSLPTFYRLVVNAQATGPEIWWTSKYCAACERVVWAPTAEGIEAQASDRGVPREVYERSWEGDDVFLLEDPGPPIVTQRFADVLDDVGVTGVTLHPAGWA
jgi:hypothetical protein